MKLRYYQREAVDAAVHWFNTQDTHPLIVLPTGAGKTVVFATLIKEIFEREPDCRILILAHRQELVSQAEDKLKKVWPCAPSGILAAGLNQYEVDGRIVIASRDTLATPSRLDTSGDFDYIIVDEAHHVAPDPKTRYRKIFDHFESSIWRTPRILGVTATPYRMGQGFIYGLEEHFFAGVAYRVGIPEMIREGFLCRLSAFKVSDEAVIDASTARVKFKGGDYRESDIEKLAMEDQTMLAIIDDWIEKAYTKGRLSTVFFCITVAHAEKMCLYLRQSGVEAAIVTGETPKAQREDVLERFENGEINALCNVSVLTEGWDAPRTDCIALLRPTKSLGLYVQICGRGMRTWGDKKDCMLLDYGENMDRHGCIDTARPSIPSKEDKEKEQQTKIWICDSCVAVNDIDRDTCIECGALKAAPIEQPKLFEEEEKDAASTRMAASGSVLSDELEDPVEKHERIKNIEYVSAESKTSKNGNEYLNVMFSSPGDYWPQNMPLMIGMNGKAGMMAQKKWRSLTNNHWCPSTIEQALVEVNHNGAMQHIKQITVRKEGKYWNVVSVHF